MSLSLNFPFMNDLSLLMNLFVSLTGYILFFLVVGVQVSVSALLNCKFLGHGFTILFLCLSQSIWHSAVHTVSTWLLAEEESGKQKNTNTDVLRSLKKSHRIE